MSSIALNPTAGGLAVRAPDIGIGRVFFVDMVNGVNTNSGLLPSEAFLTITEALTHCQDGRGDYIYVVQTLAGVDAFPITLDITYLHLIGIGGIGGASPAMELDGGGANVFSVGTTSRYLEIANFTFFSAAANGIDLTTTAYGLWIHHNQFGGSGIGDLVDGISGVGLGWGLVEDNRFGSGNHTFSLTGYGFQGTNLVMCTIRRNTFMSCALGAIVTCNIEIGPIYENYFFAEIAEGLAAGWAITLEGAVDKFPGGPITNNWAAQTGDGTGNNPYKDASTNNIATTLAGWGMNYDGQAVIVPVTA